MSWPPGKKDWDEIYSKFDLESHKPKPHGRLDSPKIEARSALGIVRAHFMPKQGHTVLAPLTWADEQLTPQLAY